MRFAKRKTAIEQLVLGHLEGVRQIIERFGDATRAVLIDKDIARAGKLALDAHRADGRVEDLSDCIALTMVEGIA
jgi:hypothetical protein